MNKKILVSSNLEPKIEKSRDINNSSPYHVKNSNWGYIDNDLWYKIQLYQNIFYDPRSENQEVSKLINYYTFKEEAFLEGELEYLQENYKRDIERILYLQKSDRENNTHYFTSNSCSVSVSRPEFLRESGSQYLVSWLGSRGDILEERVIEDILDIYKLKLKARLMNIWFKVSYPLRKRKQKKQLKKLWESLRIGYVSSSLKTDFFITLKEFYELQHWVENVIVQIHKEKQEKILEFLYKEVAKRIKY